MYNNCMSYKALYRTYRPRKFDEVVGQNHIIQTLQNVIKQNKIAHAYLFAGPRGTGKTSVAQIFANEINYNASGINKNYDLDIIEIDAASNNGVAEVRTIIENSKFAPSEGDYKIYIVDEVHMLTKGAWNALLKTLEEPPSHVVFILATTEPHKIPVTILSRTQRFNFKRIDNTIIYEHLEHVFKQENITYDEESLKFIAKLANGGLRDALSISDQAAAYGNGNISFEAISQVFGLVSINKQIELINWAFFNKSKNLIKILNSFSDNGVDLERITFSLIDILRDFIVYKKTNDPSLIVYLNSEDIKNIEISLMFAYRVVDELIKLATEIKWAELPRHLFELTILKIATFNQTNLQDQYDSEQDKSPVNHVKDQNETTSDNDSISKIGPETIRVKVKEQKTLLFNEKLHDLNFFTPDSCETIDEKDIFHTTLIETNRVNEEDEIAKTTTAKLLANSEKQQQEEITKSASSQVSNPVHEKQTSNPENAEQTLDIIKLFGLDTKTLEQKISDNHEQIRSYYTSQELINLLLLANKELLIETKERWNILSAYINSHEYGEYATTLASAKIITCGDNFLLLSSEDDEIIKILHNFRNDIACLKLLENILGKPTRIFAITRDQFEEVKKTWNIMKAEHTLPKPRPILPVKINKKNSDTEEFGLEIFGELFDK